MEKQTMLVVSTGHVSEETAAMLEDNNIGVSVYSKDDYGWFVVVTDWKEFEEEIPEDLARCLKLAEEKNCSWLCLDCDGETYPELPVYHWGASKEAFVNEIRLEAEKMQRYLQELLHEIEDNGGSYNKIRSSVAHLDMSLDVMKRNLEDGEI